MAPDEFPRFVPDRLRREATPVPSRIYRCQRNGTSSSCRGPVNMLLTQ
jgi:hypothetical protein